MGGECAVESEYNGRRMCSNMGVEWLINVGEECAVESE